MKKVFVSGCYDILHAGHVQFFTEARALGDHLTVCFASAEVLWRHKGRKSSLPDEHKRVLLESLRMVDAVVIGNGPVEGMDFEEHFLELRPDVLAVTEDDKYTAAKLALCASVGARYELLPKTPPRFAPVSTTQLVRWIRAPLQAPLRVDFAGGWLDVPRFAWADGYIVNCAISPTVSLQDWPYQRHAGLGGSGAWAVLNGEIGVDSELALGVGWQDPAVIAETGVCVWRSGPRPVLDFKRNGDWLSGRLALWWSGQSHDTPSLANQARDFAGIALSSRQARAGVLAGDLEKLAEGVHTYHATQLAEGMAPLPAESSALAWKYCGGGWGGYAVYLFSDSSARDAFCRGPGTLAVEPFTR
jgi:cytidyltransferase-like protein